MSMKNSFSLLAAMALMSGEHMMSYKTREQYTRKTAPMPNGMKEWDIDGVIVFAATKKAAIKKANKKQ